MFIRINAKFTKTYSSVDKAEKAAVRVVSDINIPVGQVNVVIAAVDGRFTPVFHIRPNAEGWVAVCLAQHSFYVFN